MKTFLKDIFSGKDGKWSLRAIMAFLTGVAFWTAGLLDATTEGVRVNAEYYWACVVLITSLLAIRALQYIGEIKNGKSNESN